VGGKGGKGGLLQIGVEEDGRKRYMNVKPI
jgi:hypothetical protein